MYMTLPGNFDAEPVQELRVLAEFPSVWQGKFLDADKNYASFEKWFSDHVGLRNGMIRAKNEIDYQLFRSSSRVYFGSENELYGRHLSDFELLYTEQLLDSPAKIESYYEGVVKYSDNLKALGITTIFVVPVQKQYFTRDRLPFFAPRLTESSNFMSLYQRMKNSPRLHFVDVVGIIEAHRGQFPLYYKQDFHWTDLTARLVSIETVNTIAAIEGAQATQGHPLEIEYQPFVGSEARFSSRLSAEEIIEPELKHNWQDVHKTIQMNPKETGLEFETDTLTDSALLPSTCMYGNSFSEGMMRSGLPDFFQKFTKLDRTLPLPQVPDLIRGKCKYLIVQVLDIQADRWYSLARLVDLK